MDDKFKTKETKDSKHQLRVEQVRIEAGAFENVNPFLLLGHPLKQLSVRLLCPEQLPPEHDHFLLGVRPGLPLRLQSLQGLMERCLGLCQVGLHRVKFPLGSSRPLDCT